MKKIDPDPLGGEAGHTAHDHQNILPLPLHPPPPEINEWHQQAYGVPFMSAEDEEGEEEEYFDDREQYVLPPHQGDPGQSSSYPPSQDPSGSYPPQLSLGKKTL